MKDAQGTELQVGDTVAFTSYSVGALGGGLSFGVVDRFTSCKIVIKRLNRCYYRNSEYVVKVKDV